MYSAPPLTQEPVWLFARRENVAPATVLLKKVKIRGRVLGGHWSHKSRHQFQRLSAQPPFRLRLKCLSLPAYRLSLKLPCLPPCRLSLKHPSQSHSPTAFTAIGPCGADRPHGRRCLRQRYAIIAEAAAIEAAERARRRIRPRTIPPGAV